MWLSPAPPAEGAIAESTSVTKEGASPTEISYISYRQRSKKIYKHIVFIRID